MAASKISLLSAFLRKQLDNKVDMLVQLTELAFVLLLERLHPRLNMLIANAPWVGCLSAK